ncbi:MAG: hypothetical protein ACTHN5_09870 [Phycisphaerae bacterium]
MAYPVMPVVNAPKNKGPPAYRGNMKPTAKFTIRVAVMAYFSVLALSTALTFWYAFLWTTGKTTLYLSRVGMGVYAHADNEVPTRIVRTTDLGFSYYLRTPRFLIHTGNVNVLIPLWCVWLLSLPPGALAWRLTRTRQGRKGFPMETATTTI